VEKTEEHMAMTASTVATMKVAQIAVSTGWDASLFETRIIAVLSLAIGMHKS
jgi:hypothetical protein